MKKTLFIDIDGTIAKHKGNLTKMFINDMEILPGVVEKFNEWDAKGYKIIITTGRKECLRKITEDQLNPLFCTWRAAKQDAPLPIEALCAELSTPNTNISSRDFPGDNVVYIEGSIPTETGLAHSLCIL